MDASGDFDLDYDLGPQLAPPDPVASRTIAFLALMQAVDIARDPKVKREGLEMLKRVRLSIRNLSDAPLASVK